MTTRTADSGIIQTTAELEINGRVTITYTFDPPIPAGTKVSLHAESDQAFMWHVIDWKGVAQ